MLSIFFSIAGFYLLAGFFFAIAFLLKGITVVDASAHGSGIGFKIIILPGVIMFWPFLLKKWIQKKDSVSPADE